VNIPLSTYRAETGEPRQPISDACETVAWRSSIEYRAPSGMLPTGSRIVDAHFRLTDPLPGLYYYGIELFRNFARRGTRKFMRIPARAMAAAMQFFM